MAKVTTITINGKKVNLNLSTQKAQDAMAALIQAACERRFGIGDMLSHTNGDDYLLTRIKQPNGTLRAYLINTDTGKARNSRKVVLVKTDDADFANGYVTDIPAENDRFIDPENPSELLDM